MTGESGIEAAVRFVRNGRTNTAITSIQDEAAQVRAIVTGAIQAYLPFHPSREEGLREAADIASDFAEAASSNADRLGQSSVWESAARTTARDIASAILALIPTKPEAKESAEDLLRDIRDHIDDPEYIKLLRPEIEAALQSKKPE